MDFKIPSDTVDHTFELTYSVRPDRDEAHLLQSAWIGTTGVTVGMLVDKLLSVVPRIDRVDLVGAIASNLSYEASAVIAVIVGFFGLVTNPLTHRTKAWMLLPLGLAAVLFLMGIGAITF